jgi:excisionase family DNA binding protein
MTALIDIEECSEFLHLSKSCIYKKTSAKSIPHIRIGGKLLFNPEKLKTWVEEHEVIPIRY